MPKASPKTLSKSPSIQVDVVSDSPAIARQDPIAARWASARQHLERAALALKINCALQIMAGFELVELHKVYLVRPGRPKGDKSFHGERISWAAAVHKELGVSEATAWRWMEMAKAARPRLAKLDCDLSRLLSRPPSDLTAAERELLTKAVHKLADGQTQLDLMLEWGLTKQERRTGRGGRLGSGGAGEPPSPQDQVEADATEARRWWAQEALLLANHLVEHRTWRHLPDTPTGEGGLSLEELEALLRTALEDIASVRKGRAAA